MAEPREIRVLLGNCLLTLETCIVYLHSLFDGLVDSKVEWLVNIKFCRASASIMDLFEKLENRASNLWPNVRKVLYMLFRSLADRE